MRCKVHEYNDNQLREISRLRWGSWGSGYFSCLALMTIGMMISEWIYQFKSLKEWQALSVKAGVAKVSDTGKFEWIKQGAE